MEKVDELAAHIVEQQKNIEAAKVELASVPRPRSRSGRHAGLRTYSGSKASWNARRGQTACTNFWIPITGWSRAKAKTPWPESQGDFCGGCYTAAHAEQPCRAADVAGDRVPQLRTLGI